MKMLLPAWQVDANFFLEMLYQALLNLGLLVIIGFVYVLMYWLLYDRSYSLSDTMAGQPELNSGCGGTGIKSGKARRFPIYSLNFEDM